MQISGEGKFGVERWERMGWGTTARTQRHHRVRTSRGREGGGRGKLLFKDRRGREGSTILLGVWAGILK